MGSINKQHSSRRLTVGIRAGPYGFGTIPTGSAASRRGRLLSSAFGREVFMRNVILLVALAATLAGCTPAIVFMTPAVPPTVKGMPNMPSKP